VPIFLGIDGGGSKTSCLIGDENSVLGSGASGGSNVIRVGEAKAREALAAAIRQACVVAGVGPDQIARTCVGLAGAGRAEISSSAQRLLADLVSGKIEVVGDMVVALAAAFGSGPGVVVIAGTGSIAYGRNAQGRTARAGGWGFAISDEGSGHWIGCAAVAAAMRSQDEGQGAGGLLANIMKAWGSGTIEEFVRAANASAPPDFAGLLPVVLAAADAGHTTARAVLTQAGVELAELAKIVIRKLFPEGDSVPVAMCGGVFSNCALVRQVFYNSLRSEYDGVNLNASVVEPVRGALEMARRD
jgi:glucosamine kinase